MERCCQAAASFPPGEFMVFWDFASLHQKDADGKRTPDEATAFGAALSGMQVWYAHPLATAFLKWCPAYTLLGIRTCKAD